MPTTIKDVEAALTDAIAAAKRISGPDTSNTFMYPVSESSSILRDFPDEGTVYVEGYGDDANKVYSPSLAGLRIILELYRQMTGHEISDEMIDSSLRHEDQHARAARIAGEVSLRYGVEIFEIESEGTSKPRIGYAPFTNIVELTTTKLALAATYVHPVDPGMGDIQNVIDMGYDGVEDVAQRAIAYNTEAGALIIPEPLSFAAANYR